MPAVPGEEVLAMKPNDESLATQHKGWHSRGYIPNFDEPGLIQSITFRLADSLPPDVVQRLKEEKDEVSDLARRQLIETYMDAGYGACHLRDPRIGSLLQEALLHFDGERYLLAAWVIMPNHVHVIVEIMSGYPLDKVVGSWKSFTAKEANRILKRSGRFWYPDYFDRYIRDERHYANAVNYIHKNPVKAGLVKRAKEWPFSSLAYYK
jgi:REP element-mobilizing transposase RayT